jgi:hypothetical protein
MLLRAPLFRLAAGCFVREARLVVPAVRRPPARLFELDPMFDF